MTAQLSILPPYRVGKWLPSDQAILVAWLERKLTEVREAPDAPLHPVIQEFKDFIEGNADIYMYFNEMFAEVPLRVRENPSRDPQVRSYEEMLRLFNNIMTTAPEYSDSGLVGFPFNAILDWSMATTNGFAAFLNDDVNAMFKKMFDSWATFLESADSAYVLNEDPETGWLGEAAMKAMPGFKENFKCDPEKPHWGFTSWDDFFTREFREDARPVAAPDDWNVISNACESGPFKIAHNVRKRDSFWIKSQPYSLQHMMDNDDYTDQFVGGTVYQAFLSALNYHRWHAPVDGTVVKTRVIEGTYYAEALAEGVDPSGPNRSQGYITELATRGLIYIQADNPAIGLMCFMAVGMSEVSTCDITVYPGQRVKKGDETGMFHFGGSTHCLIFRPEVELEFDMHGTEPGLDAKVIDINARIATVKNG